MYDTNLKFSVQNKIKRSVNTPPGSCGLLRIAAITRINRKEEGKREREKEKNRKLQELPQKCECVDRRERESLKSLSDLAAPRDHLSLSAKGSEKREREDREMKIDE